MSKSEKKLLFGLLFVIIFAFFLIFVISQENKDNIVDKTTKKTLAITKSFVSNITDVFKNTQQYVKSRRAKLTNTKLNKTQSNHAKKLQNSAIKRASIEEKKILLNSYFGDYRNKANHKKIRGNIILQVWQNYANYCRSLSTTMQKVMCGGDTYNLSVEYDEIWETKHTDDSIMKLYWKEDKVQACTIAEYLNLSKFTNDRLSGAAHKITMIFDRESILRDYNK